MWSMTSSVSNDALRVPTVLQAFAVRTGLDSPDVAAGITRGTIALRSVLHEGSGEGHRRRRPHLIVTRPGCRS